MTRVDPIATAEQRRMVRAFKQWSNKESTQRVLWLLLAIGVSVGLFQWYRSTQLAWPLLLAPVLLIATYPTSEIIARRWAARSFSSESDMVPILAIGRIVWHGNTDLTGRYDQQKLAEIAEWTRAILTDNTWGPRLRQSETLMKLADLTTSEREL